MCIGHSHYESLVNVTVTAMLVALLLPPLGALLKHFGLSGWIVGAVAMFSSIVGALTLIFLFACLTELGERFTSWRHHRRHK